MKNIKFEAAVRAAVASIATEELAQQAADGGAHGESYRIAVHDKFQDEIILGHIAITVFYGSEKAVTKIFEAVKDASNVIRSQEGEMDADMDGDTC